MASIRGSNRRKAAAQERIDERLPSLVERLGLDVPEMPTFRRDPHREAAERAEWMADVLDEIEAAVATGDDANDLRLKAAVERIEELEAALSEPEGEPEAPPDDPDTPDEDADQQKAAPKDGKRATKGKGK